MIYFLCFCFLAGGCGGIKVHQTPPALIQSPGDKVQLVCTHNQTEHRVMIWYRQPAGQTELKLIGHLNYKDVAMEKSYKQNFNISGDLSQNDIKNVSLAFRLTGAADSGVYYCAARAGGAFSEAYFGAGTKLTVLEPNRVPTPPDVVVFKPSKKECQAENGKENNKTLVCVASGFYPDHVTVSWQINGLNVVDGVATDHRADRPGDYYRITSRLRVPFSKWFKPGTNFTCIVSFFDGNKTVPYSNWVTGISEPRGPPRGKYLKITHNAKLSYVVLILKSSVYGLFVAFLVWKLQGLPRKQKQSM